MENKKCKKKNIKESSISILQLKEMKNTEKN